MEEQEEYYVLYGKDPENLDQATGSIPSLSDTSIINSTYSLVVTGLESGVVYYAQVVAAFDVFERFSEATVFLTKAPGKFSSNFFILQMISNVVYLQGKQSISNFFLLESPLQH